MPTTTFVCRPPVRASRLAVVNDDSMEYPAPRPASRWLVLGAGALGLGAIVELIVGLVVLS